MVKGISRQVIVVHSPEPKLFEQAIFILKDEAVRDTGVTDEELMKEAKRLMGSDGNKRKRFLLWGSLWAAGGASVTAAVWALSMLL